MTTQIDYYVLDQIEMNACGDYLGYRGDETYDVFPLTAEDTDITLIESGYAKCDAPGTETFIVLKEDIEG